MFVLNPDPYLLPAYRISPFTTKDITVQQELPDDHSIDFYFEKRFGGLNFLYTFNGREAINIALNYYNLDKNDIVTVLTTSGNYYISNCVTTEIEKFCKWSRELEKKTKVILVNHEFGYPFKHFGEIKKTNIPIIEDCAHSFFSNAEDGSTGTTGEFSIYSFPKMFSIQTGGLLAYKNPAKPIGKSRIDEINLKYIKKILSHQIISKEEIISKRLRNYNYLKERFESLGFTERFHLLPGVVPGVFMFKTRGKDVNLPLLKEHFYAHGVQCSVFYGEDSFFIPVHQNLTIADCEYFFVVFKEFLRSR